MNVSTGFYLLFSIVIIDLIQADFWSDRNQTLEKEYKQLLGSSIQLTEDEEKVNNLLMKLKWKEYDNGFLNSSKFLPAFHFFQTKDKIQKSEVFKFIQKLPKGAVLHSHSESLLSFEAFYQLTYMEGLYGCNKNGTFKLQFFFEKVDNECLWKPLETWRKDPNFDEYLKSQLTLVVDNPQDTYKSIDEVWSKFDKIFSTVNPLFSYRKFVHDYIYQTLQEYYEDNVKYLEIRKNFQITFDSNNRVYDKFETIKFYFRILEEFQKQHPDFLGFRFIYSRTRLRNNLDNVIEDFLETKNKFPDYIAGFDLVGQEDKGQPLTAFIEQLLNLSTSTKFYFHAGETNWYGSSTDLNLIDAILLNTSRIGHGFAITKHPEVLRLIKEKNIAVEVNPVSNQVLKLVDDLRNHIGAYLISQGYPVVITCDDPTFWGTKGLSYDWYMAFMAMTPRDGDLRILKQLAFNSFKYSSLDEEKKKFAISQLEGWWDDFIVDVLETY